MFTVPEGFQIVSLVDRRSVLATCGTKASQFLFDTCERSQFVGQSSELLGGVGRGARQRAGLPDFAD